MNICMPDSATMNDARVGITIFGILPAIMSLMIGSLPCISAACRRKIFCMMKACTICLQKPFMTLLSKKCGNSKSMPLSEDTEKAICLAIRVPDLKACTKASVWMNFSRTRCVKDLTITPPTAEAIYRPDLLKKSALFPCRLSPGKCSWADGLMSNSRLWKSIAPM